MANVDAADLANRVLPSGEWGTGHPVHGQVTMAGEAAGSTLRFVKIPAYSRVMRVERKSAALGTGVTMSYGTLGADTGTANATALAAAASHASAVARSSLDFVPFKVTEDTYITGTSGGGAGTGQVDLVVDYVYEGV